MEICDAEVDLHECPPKTFCKVERSVQCLTVRVGVFARNWGAKRFAFEGYPEPMEADSFADAWRGIGAAYPLGSDAEFVPHSSHLTIPC